MYDPNLNGLPNCYSPSVEDIEPHGAAGPGDHWFYVLAEGTHPGNGQPDSPTCNGAAVTGIGIQAATQVLYNAMLMKTFASSYPAYRLWTLIAATNLFPGNCTAYNTVKAAWDAVSVPAQAQEPTCGQTGITVPDVTGLKADRATQTITAAGLVRGTVTSVVDCDHLGVVSRQTPPAATVVAPLSAVDITVGKAPAPPRVCG